VHSKPGEPAGRGKIERFFRTVRSQFLVEVAQREPADLDELNALFIAWVEQVYHHRAHRETGQSPLVRFMAAGIPDLPSAELLREAFLWEAVRTVTKTATVSLAGNRYATDPQLVGRKVQCVFDPFDLTEVEIRWQDQSFGYAAIHTIDAHVHPDATGHLAHPDDMPAVHSGIDYLALVHAEHEQGTRRSISFADLHDGLGDSSGGTAAAWDEPPLPFPDGPDSTDNDSDSDELHAEVAQ
jgi:putative transposase